MVVHVKVNEEVSEGLVNREQNHLLACLKQVFHCVDRRLVHGEVHNRPAHLLVEVVYHELDTEQFDLRVHFVELGFGLIEVQRQNFLFLLAV